MGPVKILREASLKKEKEKMILLLPQKTGKRFSYKKMTCSFINTVFYLKRIFLKNKDN